MPTARWGTGAGVIDGRVYVVGGAYSWMSAYAAVEAYDPVSDMWTGGSQMQVARYRHAVEVIDGLLYVAGGLRWTEDEEYEGLRELLVYDPVAQSWDSLPDMNVPRDHPASGVIDGKLYVVGGWLVTVGGYFSALTDVLEVYDPVAGEWTILSPMPTARSGAAAGVISGRLYVAGGMIGADLRTSVLEIYDPSSDTWTTGAEMSRPRAEGSAAVLNDKLYVAGGF
jgi:N-acetylneuraminic acid mutarotase